MTMSRLYKYSQFVVSKHQWCPGKSLQLIKKKKIKVLNTNNFNEKTPFLLIDIQNVDRIAAACPLTAIPHQLEIKGWNFERASSVLIANFRSNVAFHRPLIRQMFPVQQRMRICGCRMALPSIIRVFYCCPSTYFRLKTDTGITTPKTSLGFLFSAHYSYDYVVIYTC